MNRFIRLTPRRGGQLLLINPEHIVSIEDLRTDKAVAGLKEWHFTFLSTIKNRYEVTETAEEIINLITGLQ